MGEKLHMLESRENLNLTENECSLVIELLEEEIPGLREEIRHTDDRQYRADLKEREKASIALLTKLRQQPEPAIESPAL
jgi:hypothetical protein